MRKDLKMTVNFFDFKSIASILIINDIKRNFNEL